MAEEKRLINLIDFFYVDTRRITSLYSQIYGGLKTGHEQLEHNRNYNEKEGGLKTVISANIKSVSEGFASVKNIYNPHDQIAKDVINILEPVLAGYASTNPNELFLEKGQIQVFDMASFSNFKSGINLMGQDHASSRGASEMLAMLDFMGTMKMPCLALFQTQDTLLNSCVKLDGFNDAIEVIYRQYGSNQIPEIKMIAIKNVGQPLSDPIGNEMINMMNALPNLYRQIFETSDCFATPIVIYRTIGSFLI